MIIKQEPAVTFLSHFMLPQNKMNFSEMVSAKKETSMELVDVQLRMQEEFRAAIADNTQ